MELAGANTGVGWAGPDLLLGFMAAAGGEAAFADASDGAVRVDVPVPADAERGWLTPDGTRHYLGLTSGVVETLDAGTGLSIGPTFEAGGLPVWVSASPDGSRVVDHPADRRRPRTARLRRADRAISSSPASKEPGVTAVGADRPPLRRDGRPDRGPRPRTLATGRHDPRGTRRDQLASGRPRRPHHARDGERRHRVADRSGERDHGWAMRSRRTAPLIIQGFLRPDGRRCRRQRRAGRPAVGPRSAASVRGGVPHRRA